MDLSNPSDHGAYRHPGHRDPQSVERAIDQDIPRAPAGSHLLSHRQL